MKKQIAKTLRTLADWICPLYEGGLPNRDTPKIYQEDLVCMTMRYSIEEGEYVERLKRIMSSPARKLSAQAPLESICLKECREKIEENIISAIKANGLIEHTMTVEPFVISGLMRVYVKKEKAK